MNPDPFAQAMVSLRSHMLDCYNCRHFIHDPAADASCPVGMRLAARLIYTCDALLKAKRAASGTFNDYIYACPDPAEHGEAYALTAQPMSVTAIQDELF